MSDKTPQEESYRIVRYFGHTYTPDDYLTSGLAYRFLGISATTLYNMSRDGQIPHRERTLSRVERLYKVSELMAWARKRGISVNRKYLVIPQLNPANEVQTGGNVV